MSQSQESAEVWAEVVTDVLPDDLDVMPPGPRLAAVLASVDRSELDAPDLLRLAAARVRLLAHLDAQLLADLHRVARVVPDRGRQDGRREPGRYPWAETEAAFALRWTHGRAVGQMLFADEVIDRLPQVFAALDAGEIDVPKARIIVDAVADLDGDVARRIVEKVLGKAWEQTTGELRARLRRLVLAADPDRAEKRARRQISERRVQAFLGENSLATLAGYELAPHRVAAVTERLDAIARAAKSAGDARRIDQIRADAFLDLLVGEGIAVGERISDGGLGYERTTANADPIPRTRPAGSVLRAAPGQHPSDAADAADSADSADAAAGREPAREPRLVAETDVRDGDEQDLQRFYLAGFDQLATTRPGSCRCGDTPAGATRPTATRPTATRPTATAATAAGVASAASAGGAGVGGAARAALPAPRRGVIDLQVPLTTLMGLTRLPGQIAGWGPVLSEIATAVARERSDATWRYSVYDNFGELAHHGILRRRPSAKDTAFIKARDRTCRAPGCRRAALGCDVDHVVDWQRSRDSRRCNLACLCRLHHRYKHRTGATLTQLSPGVITWQTPLGPQYVTYPDQYENHLDPPELV